MSKSQADQREHGLIDRMPNMTQGKYGFAKSSEIDWNLKNTNFNHAFKAMRWSYKESKIANLHGNKKLKPKIEHDIDKSKAVKFSTL